MAHGGFEMGADRFLLTGAASGIGRGLCDALAKRGASVFATDVRRDALEAAAEAGGWPPARVKLRTLDVRDAVSWEVALDEAVAAFGGIDVLLNVAGYLRPAWIKDASPEDVGRHFDTNAKGVILGTMAAARRMAAAGHGHIVNIASMAALAPIPGIALYSASKYAVRAFSLAAAVELREHGVAVTVVCPDAVQTPMLDLQKSREEAALTFSGKRVLCVDEVVQAILGRVLEKRPIEVVLSATASRRWLARLADVFPRLVFAGAARNIKKGRAKQVAQRKG